MCRDAQFDLLNALVEYMKQGGVLYKDIISALARPLVTADPSVEEREIIALLAGWRYRNHSLTLGELASMLGEQIMNEAKYLVRVERHGDASKPGALENP
jgi:hypothetical protein